MEFMVAESIVSALKQVATIPLNQNDSLLFQGKQLPINSDDFSPLQNLNLEKEVFFIDGGQAELLVASNFVLAYLRVAAVGFKGLKKTAIETFEAYVLVSASGNNGSIVYSAKLFDVKGKASSLVDNELLKVNSEDQLFRSGIGRAPITKLVSMTRRFLELGLAKEISSKEGSVVVLDGTLDARYPGEEKIVSLLPENVVALAKSSQLFTASGGSPTVSLSKLSPFLESAWIHSFDSHLHFVKLHPKSNHIFRFSGSKEYAALLIELSTDPIFLGYPYPLILVDRLARVSDREKSRLRSQFLLRKDLSELREFLATSDAHGILDRVG
ncbi:hypothetical protein HOA92_07400 [archaeon]|jgi:hypothetical protein|nr:hypothetical protein [archaeon]MBT6762839.1 hypothetical protein [archaeon]